jgi:hypothetical protein
MPKYVIEREIPGAGAMSEDELRDVAIKSNTVLTEMGPEIQWIQSYVTTDKLYCIYISPNEEMIHTHAAKGGFPVNRISRVAMIIDPSTAEMPEYAA